MRKKVATDLVLKFLERVDATLVELLREDGEWWEHPCCLWGGALINFGGGAGYRRKVSYGIFRARTAHSWLFNAFVRPTRPGEQVHHKCQNPQCVRLSHLEAMTPKAHARHHSHRGPKRLRWAERYTPKRRYKVKAA
jgi:hypothetical protein